MRKRLSFFFLIILGFYGSLLAQTPQVPTEMYFADIKLEITDGARKEIQTHVDALYRSEKYFNIKLERVDLYFPIIEKIFEEENLPDDFKYLVIQESALISDAVSSSNAVGFWQFKEASGEEVGLRVDGTVDERMNIVSSTRGAAKYLKRNNNYYGNWLYALLSYNMGAGGAQKVVNDKYFGAKKMEIDKRTHWYIMKFLAHKVAFESAIGKNASPALILIAYTNGANKGLKQIASETGVDYQLLEEYNKWLKRGDVPDDKKYSVIIPTTPGETNNLVAINNDVEEKPLQSKVKIEKTNPSFDNRFSKGSDKYPIIEGGTPGSNKESMLVTVNGKPGIIAGLNDNLLQLAAIGDVSISRFLKYNDLESEDQAIVGQVYYLKSKKGRAPEHYHVVKETENMWSISQKYGIKLRKLRSKNRMEEAEQPKPGRVLWMRFLRPKDEPIEYKEIPASGSGDLVNAQSGNSSIEKVEIANDLPAESQSVKHEEVIEEEIISEAEMAEEFKDAENIEVEESIAEVPQQDDETTDLVDDQQVIETTDGDLEEETSFASGQEDIKFVDTEASENEREVGNEGTHKVKQGETLYSIARLYNIQLGEILLWNNLSLRDGIKVDQVLKISSPDEELSAEQSEPVIKEDNYIIHEVATGETMYKIARDHNVTIKDVMQWNNKSDFGVSIGEKLKIKKVNE